MSYRENGFKMLKSVLPKKLASKTKFLEDKIYSYTQSEDTFRIEYIYRDLLYQILVEISKTEKYDEEYINRLVKLIDERKVLRDHPDFYKLYLDEGEQNNFIIKPFEVEEGISTCNKCGSKRVFSYQKQSRSSDEPSTTYCECVACRSRWTYSG